MLLHEGCNPLAVSHSGKTALQLALEENQHQVATVLTAATSKVWLALFCDYTITCTACMYVSSQQNFFCDSHSLVLRLTCQQSNDQALGFLAYCPLQSSEDPVYRISSLEGQLRHCQNKLAESLRNFELELVKQQLSSKVTLETMQNEHQSEMNKALQKIKDLEKRIGDTDKPIAAIPTIAEPPPLLPKSPTRKKRRSKKLVTQTPNNSKSELPDTLVTPPKSINHTTCSETNLLKFKGRPRSASYNDLTEIINEANDNDTKLPITPQLSPATSKKGSERKLSRRESSERNTITSLVAESLANPSSMLAIRKELKSDSFTPKIQRKFHKRGSGSSGNALPTMSPGNHGAAAEGEGKEGKSPRNTKGVL